MSSRRSGRWGRRLIITLVVLGVLAVAVDRAAAWVAQNQLASMAEKEAAQYDVTAADTSVHIGGFGFLPQLAKEKFSNVTLTMKQPTFEKVRAEDLQVEMTGVHVPRGLLTRQPGTAVTVDSTTMRVQMAPAELARLAAQATGLNGLTMRAADGQLHAGLSIGGFSADVVVNPQVDNGRIRLAVDQLNASLPPIIQNAIKSQLSRGITIPKLPFDAQLNQVGVDGDSVVLTASIANLTFEA